MKITDDELKLRLESLETEQNRLNGILNDVHELKVKINNLKITLTHHDDVTTPLVLTNNEKATTTKQLNTTPTPSGRSDRHGYVVCLMFNPKSPPEWSGKEWHRHGKGKCYTSSEQAYQCLLQLRKRWPGYPLQVLESSLGSIEHVDSE
ncbi:MAG TPA: hypothetical protein ENI48_05840 [Thioploca sp.]|nr:hypothetical protein [Thioploca sp.]